MYELLFLYKNILLFIIINNKELLLDNKMYSLKT